ncbi:MAG: hypothetical protein Q8O83_03195 [bacterium]|nr:hypothetical protein [bacterium]
MQKTPRTTEQGIISLIAIFGVGLFALGAVLSISTGTLAELVKNKNAVTGSQAFYTAESAMQEGAYQFVGEVNETQNENFRTLDYFTLNNSAESGVIISDLGWPYAEARGAASNGDTNRTVIHTITIFPEGLAFDYAVYAQHELNFGGSSEINGNIFANDGIDFTGNNAEVNGDAFSPEEFTDTDNITGDAISGVEPIPPPTLDTDEYRDAANQIFPDSHDAEDFLNNQEQTARIFIEDIGETKIQGNNTVLQGFFATMGDLDISGGIITADDTYAALVVMGNLKISGGTTINGVVYVTGNTTFGSGNNVINGSLISAGAVSVTAITGNATINYDADATANWENLAGLNTVSTEEPRIIRWEEE